MKMITVYAIWYMNNGKSPEIELVGSRKQLVDRVTQLVGKYDRFGWKTFKLKIGRVRCTSTK